MTARCRSCDLAWAAGFLDADGSFGIARINFRPRDRGPNRTNRHYHRAELRCEQVGTSAELPIRKLASTLGGRVTTTGRGGYAWTTENIEQIAVIMRRLLPYLSRKRAEAEVLLAYCEGPGKPRPRQPTSPEVWKERESYVLELLRVREANRGAMRVV